ncbi:hypothetical protein HDK77DRAFT_429238 [Phyllosticta capitalensis]
MAGFSAPIHLLLVLIQCGFCYGLTPGCKSPDSDAAVLSSHALYTVYPSSAGNSPLTVTATLYLTLPAPLSSRPTPLPELRYLRDTENEEWSVLRAAKDSTTLPTASSSFMSTCPSKQSLATSTTSSAATTCPLQTQFTHSTFSKSSPTTTPCPPCPASSCQSLWASLADAVKTTKRTYLDAILLQTTLIAERLEKLNDFVLEDDLGEVWEMLMVLFCGFFGYAVGTLLMRMKRAWARCQGFGGSFVSNVCLLPNKLDQDLEWAFRVCTLSFFPQALDQHHHNQNTPRTPLPTELPPTFTPIMAGLPVLIHLLLAFFNFASALLHRLQVTIMRAVSHFLLPFLSPRSHNSNSLAILMMPNTTSSVATPSSLKQLNANMLPDALASTPTVQDSAIMASSSEQQDASEVTSSLDPTATHDLLALESASPSSPTGSESLHANIIVNSSTLPMIQPPILIVACYSEIYLHNGSCVSPTATELDTFRTELWASKMKTLVVENLLQMCKITPALILIVLQTYGTAQGLEKVMHRNGGLSQGLARSISAIVALPLISIGFYVYFGSFHLTWSFVVYVFYIFVTGE